MPQFPHYSGRRRNQPVLTWQSSCTTRHPMPFRTALVTIGVWAEATGVRIVSTGEWLVSKLAAQIKKKMSKPSEWVA